MIMGKMSFFSMSYFFGIQFTANSLSRISSGLCSGTDCIQETTEMF